MSYIDFEGAHKFPTKTTGRKVISDKGTRPAVYSAWTKIGRPYSNTMNIGAVDPYRATWWSWWSAHMPAVRRLPGGSLLDPARLVDVIRSSDDWEGLDQVFGKDGMLQFLLTLLWWGDAVHGRGNAKQRAEWEIACADFSGILDAIIVTTGHKKANRKRKAPGDDAGPSKKARQSHEKPCPPRRSSRHTSAPTPSTSKVRRH
uniref:Expressed protein n=2 Tax=Schizophyllum commune (strain H4-8 / FGSC 9210) TaxID=578458 RepID=D8QJQ2_SCHCM